MRNGRESSAGSSTVPRDGSSQGLERVLRRAAANTRFWCRLMEDREQALAEVQGLSAAERQVLLSTPDKQLASMIREVPLIRARRGFIGWLVSGVLAALGVGGATWRIREADRRSRRTTGHSASSEAIRRAYLRTRQAKSRYDAPP